MYTPQQLSTELECLVRAKIMDPLLVLGEPGVGKSAIVKQVAAAHGMEVHDVRWGQMAPVDVRGVPVVDREKKVTEFYAPTFWPRTGPGVIFLDEFNMASAAMMGLAQQLLLDRKFGDYSVPDSVFVWAAGNRKEDRAAVNDIPSPVQNRVAHYEVAHDYESWKIWAHGATIDPRIIDFCRFRPNLLHSPDPSSKSMAWPSPRTWEMAHRRLQAGMSIEPLVGEGASAEFDAYCLMIDKLPDLEKIIAGRGGDIPFPDEPSLKYAVVAFLTAAAMKEFEMYKHGFNWMVKAADKEPEYTQMFILDVSKVVGRIDKSKAAEYVRGLAGMKEAKRYLEEQGA